MFIFHTIMQQKIDKFDEQTSKQINELAPSIFNKYNNNKYDTRYSCVYVNITIDMCTEIIENGFFSAKYNIDPKEFIVMYIYTFHKMYNSHDKTHMINTLMPNIRQILKNTDNMLDYNEIFDATLEDYNEVKTNYEHLWNCPYKSPEQIFLDYQLSYATLAVLINGVARLRKNKCTLNYLPEFLELPNDGAFI